MLPVTAVAHLGLLVVSAVTTSGLAVASWRRRRQPGAWPFVGLMLATTVWTVSYAAGLVTPMYTARVFWEQMQWFGIPFVPLFLFLFFVTYAGYGELATTRTVVVLAVVPALTFLLVWTNPLHDLVWQGTVLRRTSGLVVASQTFGPGYWMNLFYTYLLVGGSICLLGVAIYRETHPFSRTSALLAAGIMVPLVANFASVFSLGPVEGLDMTPYAFTVTGLVFSRAIFDHRLFRHSPAVSRLGRHSTLAALEDGVLLVDSDGTVVSANDAAHIFDADPVGRPVASLLPVLPDDGDQPTMCTIDGRSYEVSASTIGEGVPIGTVYLLYDVTDRERRLAELQRQRAELDTLAGVNDIIRSVGRVLVTSSTHETIREGVCHQLSAAEPYTAAHFSSEARAETTVETVPSSKREAEPGAVRIAVPVVYGEATYGTLFVDRARDDDITDRELAILTELGENVGMALNAAEARRTLLSDSVVVIDYSLTANQSLLAEAAAAMGTELQLRGLVPLDGEALLVYVEDATDDKERLATWFRDQPTVTAVREVGDTVELRLTGNSPLHVLSQHGVRILSATADIEGFVVSVETASGTGVRSLTDALESVVGRVSVLAKRERTSADAEAGDPAGMTDRQRESLASAYHAGYFSWPRDSTAEEVADAMDIAPSTLHSHLRKGQAKLVESYLDETDDEQGR
ncbi:histidine kinase N-terminal 7TM domain-containing protein [Halorarius litoreus]|uniref:histidine kinase N-terminal 7TM domain-containing protein n=1 Tax=Halorarius litoreus TaxID=2962676 RepID=UPI0020CF5DEB|nr:histidine kinase N-terminal 7TM domain-containing protein [Halorarius litoreus]